MAYRWKPNQSSRANFRRLARGQLKGAISVLADPLADHADAVHNARVRLKKTRSLLRLARHAAPAAYRQENTALRDAARAFSSQRDQKAVIEAVDKLLAHAEREWNESAGAVRALRESRSRLVESHEHESNGRQREQISQHVTDQLKAALDRLDSWMPGARDERTVADGLAAGYRRARRAMRAAQEKPSPENLHEWRKQIKYHRYQARLLVDAWPAVLEAHCEELKRLTDYLGDDHDLVLLRQTVCQRLIDLDQPSRDMLREMIERRRGQLAAEAMPLGSLLFAENPKHLTRRFMRYWSAYRDRGDH